MNIEQIAQEVREEMSGAILPQVVGAYEEAFLRRCLSKLAEQVGEPVAWQDKKTGMIYTTVRPEAKHLYSPLYTEAQLIAAQQRTAEACAKVCDEIAADAGIGAGFAEAIRDEKWREYL